MKKSVNTTAVHAGEPKIMGSVCMPVFQTVIFQSQGEENYQDIRYSRMSNTPSQVAVQEKLAELEGAEAALVTASGMAAIATSVLAFAKQGSHLLVQKSLYGGSHGFFTQDCADFGISVSFFDPGSEQLEEELLQLVRPETALIYLESISNPLLEVPDFAPLVQFAKKHNLMTFVDNTVCSPALFQPLALGVDVVVHSATKYLNGHSDVLAGAICASKKNIQVIAERLLHLGASLDPHACHLLQRGIKTLGLRLAQQCESAERLALFLDELPEVKKVNYPGLKAGPSFELASKYFSGFGALISFEIDRDVEGVARFVDSLKIPVNAPSLGGIESLVTRPSTSSHLSMTAEERAAAGVSDTLVRLSVGIEDFEDLKEDIFQALKQ